MSHNRFNPILRAIAFTALAAFGVLGSLEAQIRYQLVTPEVFGSEINQTADHGNEINNNGESVLNRVASFAVWKNGTTTHVVNAITNYPGSFSKVAAASINDYQQVVGSKSYRVQKDNATQTDTFPFYWDPYNGLVDLDDIGNRSGLGVGNTALYGINKAGVAIGVTQNYSGNETAGNIAFAWSFESGRSDIAPLSVIDNQSYTAPLDINDSGTIVGNFRKFDGSTDRYFENGFVKLQDADATALSDFDNAFFSSTHSTARAVNALGNFAGEIDGKAYFYDAANAKGHVISHPSRDGGLTKAFAVNDFDVIAGTLESRDSAGKLGMLPYIWTRELGTFDLSTHVEKTLSALLPEGANSASVRITPKSINSRGQISARLETNSQFAREIILEPTLDFQWHAMSQVTEDGVTGALYVHQKAKESADSIPAEALGYEIGFESSTDMTEWSPIESGDAGIRITENETIIEVFMPFSQSTFIRPVLSQVSAM